MLRLYVIITRGWDSSVPLKKWQQLSPADNREVSPHVVWRTPEGPCAMAVHADDHRSLSNWSLEPGLLHPLKMVSPR